MSETREEIVSRIQKNATLRRALGSANVWAFFLIFAFVRSIEGIVPLGVLLFIGVAAYVIVIIAVHQQRQTLAKQAAQDAARLSELASKEVTTKISSYVDSLKIKMTAAERMKYEAAMNRIKLDLVIKRYEAKKKHEGS